MKAMHGIYDGKSVKVLDPVPVDRPMEVEIVPVRPVAVEAPIAPEQVRAKLAALFATLEGLTPAQEAILDAARLDQTNFFRTERS